MDTSLEQELVELVAPPLVDIDQLIRLVNEDQATDAFDGECTAHDSCLPLSYPRET